MLCSIFKELTQDIRIVAINNKKSLITAIACLFSSLIVKDLLDLSTAILLISLFTI